MAVFFMLNGCINLGPDYVQPDLGIQPPESYEYAPTETERIGGRGSLVGRCSVTRNSTHLVDEVLKNNWDIKQAAAQILEARSRYVEVRAGQVSQRRFRQQFRSATAWRCSAWVRAPL